MYFFVRHDVANVVHHSESPNAERIWHLIQRDTGSVALCNLYFSRTADLSEISSLRDEMDQMLQLTDAIVIGGDLHTHHKSWL